MFESELSLQDLLVLISVVSAALILLYRKLILRKGSCVNCDDCTSRCHSKPLPRIDLCSGAHPPKTK